MTIPLFEIGALDGTAIVGALVEHGAMFVRAPEVPIERFEVALADERQFFDLPDAVRAELGIENSAHFRGYSVMHNERDHREQMHFGREASAVASGGDHWRLQGPNLWPPDDGWRVRMDKWFDVTESAGCRVLHHIATSFGVNEVQWLGATPYRVAKLIAYHPQTTVGAPRSGVAPHLDFSLLTLTVQDGVGGLQVQGSDGVWTHVEPVPGAWLVHGGELLQYVTGNRVPATPHRVVNPSVQRTRYSIPYFLSPSLDVTLRPALNPAPGPGVRFMPEEHIHAVLNPEERLPFLPYGPSEWLRKGQNFWCRVCCGPSA